MLDGGKKKLGQKWGGEFSVAFFIKKTGCGSSHDNHCICPHVQGIWPPLLSLPMWLKPTSGGGRHWMNYIFGGSSNNEIAFVPSG